MTQIWIWCRDYLCFNKKFLVYNLVNRNLKIKYRRSFLGIFWTLLAPLLNAVIFFVVFRLVIQVQKPNYLVLLLSGVMFFNYYSQTMTEGISHLVDQQRLISKIALPIQIFSFTTALTNLVTLVFSIPVVLAIELIQGRIPTFSFFFLPFFLGCLFLIGYASSIILGILFVFFRDLKQILVLVVQLLFYGTPIVYTPDMIPPKFIWILQMNPIGYLVLGIQNCFLGQAPWTPSYFLTPFAWTIALSAVALVMTQKLRKSVVENL